MLEEKIQFFDHGASSGPLKLHLAGVSYCDGSYRISREPPGISVIEAVEKGHGFLMVDGVRYHPGAGDVYVAPGWKTHEYGSDAVDPWVKTWMNFSGTLMEHLLKAYRIDDVYLFRNAEEASVLIAESVRTLRTLPENEVEQYVSMQLFRIIRSLGEHQMAQRHGGKNNGPDPLADKVRLFLRKRITAPMPSLSEIAAVIGKSPVQTIRIFKQETGMTPYDFLLEEKISAAAELLTGSNKAVKEIAFMLGFNDEYYFSRLFKQKRGVSPRRFRIPSREILNISQ